MDVIFLFTIIIFCFFLIGKWQDRTAQRTTQRRSAEEHAVRNTPTSESVAGGTSSVTGVTGAGRPRLLDASKGGTESRRFSAPTVAKPAQRLVSTLETRPLHRAISSYNQVIFLDVETTGRSAQYDRIVELAMITVTASELAEWMNGQNKADVHPELHRFNPQMDIPLEASRIHGITNAIASRYPPMAPTFIHKLVQKMGPSSLIIGHNVSFDIRFLQQEVRRVAGFPTTWPPGQRHVCTMSRYRRLFPGQPYRLDNCLSSLGLAGRSTRMHSGSEDVILTAQLLVRLARLELGQ